MVLTSDHTAAEPLCHEVLEGQRETLGNQHPLTLCSINNLGTLLYAKGDVAAAEPLLQEAVARRSETLGRGHASTLASINDLSALLQKMSDLTVAIYLY